MTDEQRKRRCSLCVALLLMASAGDVCYCTLSWRMRKRRWKTFTEELWNVGTKPAGVLCVLRNMGSSAGAAEHVVSPFPSLQDELQGFSKGRGTGAHLGSGAQWTVGSQGPSGSQWQPPAFLCHLRWWHRHSSSAPEGESPGCTNSPTEGSSAGAELRTSWAHQRWKGLTDVWAAVSNVISWKIFFLLIVNVTSKSIAWKVLLNIFYFIY